MAERCEGKKVRLQSKTQLLSKGVSNAFERFVDLFVWFVDCFPRQGIFPREQLDSTLSSLVIAVNLAAIIMTHKAGMLPPLGLHA